MIIVSVCTVESLRISTSAWHLQQIIVLIKVNISEKIKENRCLLFERHVLVDDFLNWEGLSQYFIIQGIVIPLE